MFSLILNACHSSPVISLVLSVAPLCLFRSYEISLKSAAEHAAASAHAMSQVRGRVEGLGPVVGGVEIIHMK